jgi:hypothetical protein
MWLYSISTEVIEWKVVRIRIRRDRESTLGDQQIDSIQYDCSNNVKEVTCTEHVILYK